MPKHPEQGRRPEQQFPSYHLAARFREDSVSQKVYTQAQELIRTTENDLSAYRFLRPSQVAKEPPWYVVVLGEVPLYQRRLQEMQKGFYVEAHHPITLRRKQEKSKRKMQNKSRRRNRGK